MSNKSKKIEISLLRIVATIAVVFLHTCSTLTANSNKFMLTETQYGFFSSGTAIMMWAVPCFLMITGELFLSSRKEISLEMAIKKYVKRPLKGIYRCQAL